MRRPLTGRFGLVTLALIAATTGPNAAAAVAPDSANHEIVAALNNAVELRDAEPALAGDDSSEPLPSSGSSPVRLSTDNGTLAMGLPAEGDEIESGTGTAVFTGTDPGTDIAAQSTATGVRALVHIDSNQSPERFSFPIGGDVSELQRTEDGGVLALDQDGNVLAIAPAPWAVDAMGAAVPTHYEIDGTSLIQVVEHRNGDFAYGIVADPWWNPFSWDWGKIFKVTVSGLKDCGAGAAVTTLGLGAGTTATNVALVKVAGKTAIKLAGGPYAYVGAATAGCVMKLMK